MSDRKPTIVELWAQMRYHRQEIERIQHYIDTEWPEELCRHAAAATSAADKWVEEVGGDS